MVWILSLLCVTLFLYVFQTLKKKRFPPGPTSIPFLGHFHLLGKNPHQDLFRLARTHGPIMGMRFGLVPAVVVSSPTATELFLKTHDVVFASRPHNEAAKYISYEQRNFALGPYGPYWRNIRKLSTMKLLSGHKIKQFRAMRRAEVGLLVSSLKQKKEPVDVSATVFCLSGDLNNMMVLGRKYSDTDLGNGMGFQALFRETMEVAAKFNVGDYFPYVGLLDLHGLNRRMKQLATIFDGFLERILDDHATKKQGTREDFVDTMMNTIESGEAEFEFDRRNVKAVILDLLIAGSDTSAASIDWVLSELMKHPTVMKKLQQELECVVGMEHLVDESHLDKLEYLDCVIKETFRLHPIAPLLLPHESTKDCVVEGYHIPKKTRIIVNTWAIGRDPNLWPNPECFMPERFIGSEIDMSGQYFELIPFGSGRRGCPGMQLGLLVVKLVVAQLVHCFDWELPEGVLCKDIDMSEHFGFVTSRTKPLTAIPTYRLHV